MREVKLKPPGLGIKKYEHQKPWPVIMAVGLIVILSVSSLSTFLLWTPPSDIDLLLDVDQDGNLVLLLDVDQDGNLVQNVAYATNLQLQIHSYWGRITELTTGGFAIAGLLEDGNDTKIWVIRTDENYNLVWNRTYEDFPYPPNAPSIAEMNNGHLAIMYSSFSIDSDTTTLQILVVDNEGEYVREWVWHQPMPDYCIEFSHCSDGGFILQFGEGPLDPGPEGSGCWIARLDADLSVIWNRTYPELWTTQHIIEDIAGGFTLLLHREDEGVLVRLDSLGNETSRVIIDSGGVLGFDLTQCSGSKYLACNWAGMANNVACFDIEGNILWEEEYFRSGGHCRGSGVQGIEKLGPDRYVTWDSCRGGCDNPGVYLDCFDTSGTILWRRLFGVKFGDLHVVDVISNSDGGVTILGLLP